MCCERALNPRLRPTTHEQLAPAAGSTAADHAQADLLVSYTPTPVPAHWLSSESLAAGGVSLPSSYPRTAPLTQPTAIAEPLYRLHLLFYGCWPPEP
jgi:hypothetical protein